MTTIGLVGAGHMGSGLGWALRQGGNTVVTTLAGRSARTVRLATEAGVTALPDLTAVVAAADLLFVVTPPAVAEAAAQAIAAAPTDARPLVVDLNAIAPSTVERIARALGRAGFDLVDGAISGPPPTVRPGARIFLSGPASATARITDLAWPHVDLVVVGEAVGAASAVKMCTASVYKGVTAVLTQALRTAGRNGVADYVLADLADGGYEPTRQIAVAATKAWRFVDEMHQIAATQRAAGLPGELFDAVALVYEDLARTELATGDPETVDATPDRVIAALTATAD
jgi:3-hydroxyisobutyrate dehydrogenase-like beta-hydroxyacid dehydrogenase